MTSELQIRPGSIADAPILIALFDAAVDLNGWVGQVFAMPVA